MPYDINEVYTRLKCCSCDSYQRDKLISRLGAFYLHALDGNPVKPPQLSEMLQGCCRAHELLGDAAIDNSVTFIQPSSQHEQAVWDRDSQRRSAQKRWRGY